MKQSQKNEALLIFGRWTSKIGDIVFDYVNNVTIVSLCGKSAFILAIYQSSEIIVNTIFNLLGGVIADRSYKKKILIRTDLLSASICITLSFFVTSTYLTIALILANIFWLLLFHSILLHTNLLLEK
jgi:predicted MFS family arabinose efflux permease